MENAFSRETPKGFPDIKRVNVENLRGGKSKSLVWG